MKNILKHIVSFSMILILLVSTLQFSLYKMECILSGNIVVSLKEFEDCNKKPANDCSISEKCCCFHEMNFDFDFESNLSLKTFKIFNQALITGEISTVSKEFIKTTTEFFYTNLPPPSGIELLKVVQVFRL